MTNEQKIEFAKKLQALAQFGVAGEKDNAQKLLDNFLYKYNISIEDLQENDTEICIFEVQDKHKDLFHQIVYAWFNDCQIYSSKDKTKKDQLFLEMTPLHSLELKVKFEFYRNLFDEEHEIFYNAFVQKNKILPPTAKATDWNSLSQEEKEQNRRINKMQDQIQGKEFHKQLNSRV